MSRYMMKVVGRVFKIVVLLLVVTAVTTILLTPSPSDDVPGVMHRSHSHVAAAVVTGLLQIASLTRSSHLAQDPSTHPLQVSNFLELHCQHIC